MLDFCAYDDLLTSVYRASSGDVPISGVLRDVRKAFIVAAAGFSIYDDVGQTITHTIVSPRQFVSAVKLRKVNQMSNESEPRQFARMFLPEPRRMSDVIPDSRLKTAGWFRLQQELAGVGYCAAVDLQISGLRVRLFILTASSGSDLSLEQLELLGRLGKHVERAFEGKLGLLTPERYHNNLNTIVFNRDSFSGQMLVSDDRERYLVMHYGLTKTEARIAVAAALGRPRAAVALSAGIGLNTLKTHLRRIFTKLAVSRASELTLKLAHLYSKDEAWLYHGKAPVEMRGRARGFDAPSRKAPRRAVSSAR